MGLRGKKEREKKKCVWCVCDVQEWDDMTMVGDGCALVPLESLQRDLISNNDSTMKYGGHLDLCPEIDCIYLCLRYVVFCDMVL